MELGISQEKLFPANFHLSYDNHSRMRSYRHVLAGLRYHKGEKLSFVTFSFQRGTFIDIRTFFKELTTWIKRLTGERIDYYRATVFDKKVDDTWRIHTHTIWNAPYIYQPRIVEKVQTYIGENAHVDIRLIKGVDDKKAARYLMQYLGNQEGFVKFDKSRTWLPKGYNDFWNKTRFSIREHTKTSAKMPLVLDNQVLDKGYDASKDWKRVLISTMDAWIDEQRERATHQQDLYKNLNTPRKYDENKVSDLMRYYRRQCRLKAGVIR